MSIREYQISSKFYAEFKYDIKYKIKAQNRISIIWPNRYGVCPLNFRKSVIKKRYEIDKFLFLHFLNIVSADVNTLLAAPVPLLEGVGEVRRRQGPHSPLPLLLEGLGGQGLASQHTFHLREQKEVGGGQIRRIGRVFNDLDTPGSKPILDNGGRMDRGIIPMQILVLLSRYGPLLLENPHEPAQGLHDVVGIDRGPLGT